MVRAHVMTRESRKDLARSRREDAAAPWGSGRGRHSYTRKPPKGVIGHLALCQSLVRVVRASGCPTFISDLGDTSDPVWIEIPDCDLAWDTL